MLGKDGRLYDAHYDYDHDGKLSGFERSMYDDALDSAGDSFGGDRSPFTLMSNSCSIVAKIIGWIVWLCGFFMLFLLPPLGALLIMIAITITEVG